LITSIEDFKKNPNKESVDNVGSKIDKIMNEIKT